MIEKSIRVPVIVAAGENFKQVTDEIIREVPVTLFLNDEEFATLICSPGNLKELAVGFLCSENILNRQSNLLSITINEEDGLIWAEIAGNPPAAEQFLKRYITTCCGRGRASFYFVNDARGISPVSSDIRITTGQALSLMAELESLTTLFRKTGGAHGAALCSTKEVILFYEDIGRHNVVDKIFGRCFLDKTNLEDKIIVFSGRISSEILIKTAKMGIPIIISRAAPTDLAISLGNELGITIIGFARQNRLNIYTHGHRVITGNT
jgi:FdhD protein